MFLVHFAAVFCIVLAYHLVVYPFFDGVSDFGGFCCIPSSFHPSHSCIVSSLSISVSQHIAMSLIIPIYLCHRPYLCLSLFPHCPSLLTPVHFFTPSTLPLCIALLFPIFPLFPSSYATHAVNNAGPVMSTSCGRGTSASTAFTEARNSPRNIKRTGTGCWANSRGPCCCLLTTLRAW